MDIPQLPTDNLYKFKALVGVVLAVFVFCFPALKTMELRLQSYDLNTHIEKLKIETEFLSNELKLLRENKNPTNEELKVIDQKGLLNQTRAAELLGDNAKIEYQRGMLKASVIFMIIGSLLGLTLAVSGFREWHFHVQHPQDVLLRLQVESLAKQNKIDPASKDS